MLKLSAVCFFAFALFYDFGSTAEAKVEYFVKEKAEHPGVTCLTCHETVPKKDEKNTQLNDAGKKYQKDKKLPKK